MGCKEKALELFSLEYDKALHLIAKKLPLCKSSQDLYDLGKEAMELGGLMKESAKSIAHSIEKCELKIY